MQRFGCRRGGREHALGWKFAQDKRIEKIWFAPGNAGTAQVGVNLPFASTDLDGITGWAVKERPGLVVIGPEAPLCAGLADRLRGRGFWCLGLGRRALSWRSKSFCKDLLGRQKIPTACAGSFTTMKEALDFGG